MDAKTATTAEIIIRLIEIAPYAAGENDEEVGWTIEQMELEMELKRRLPGEVT